MTGRFRPLALLAILAPAPAVADEIAGHVTRVRDGDTIVVGRQPVRICGIDTPERGHEGAEEATSAMRQIALGKPARCIPVGSGTPCDGRSSSRSRDRVVAQCFIGGEDIARLMVAGRLACAWPRYSGAAYVIPGGCAR